MSTGDVRARADDLGTGPEQLLRRQDSNLDYRNQNPRCCLYTTAEEWAQAHLHMVARPLGEVCAASHTGLDDTRGTRH